MRGFLFYTGLDIFGFWFNLNSMNMKGKTVLITGASAGIGNACAEVFAQAGANLILVARREEKIKAVAAGIEKRFGFKVFPIAGDVRDQKQMEFAVSSLPAEWQKIDILVNNAGLARGLEKIQEGVLQNWEEMIDTNIKGLLYLSRLILPQMVERGDGIVINIGSIAGEEVYPAGNVYCGTKSAVKAISKGMAIDLNGTGVRVCNIEPGLVETEFSLVRFHWDNDKAKKVYFGYTPLTGKDVADAALFVATRPKHVMIQEIIITPTDQATATIINKKL